MKSGWRVGVLALTEALLLLQWGGWSSTGQERGYTIQVASVATDAEARGILSALRGRGIAAYAIRAEVPGLGLRYRVRYGRFRTAILARSEAEREVRRGSYRDFIISREELVSDKNRLVGKLAEAGPSGGGVEKSVGVPAKAPPAAAVKGEEKVAGDPVVPSVLKPSPEVRERIARVGTAIPEVVGGGGRWEVTVPPSLPAERWREMQFVDVLTGWVGGENGSVYRTNDGGRVWTEVPVGTRGRVLALAFPTWNHGWILAAGPSAGNDGAVDLFVTRDGGRRWKRRDLPGSERLYRADLLKGWAIGRGTQVGRTEDGGETWVGSASLPGTTGGENLHLADLSTVRISAEGAPWRGTLWVVGNLFENGQHRLGGLWRSDDDGGSWVRITLPAGLSGKSGRFLSVRFQSGGRGLISGEVVESEGRRWFLLETSDGGLSWKMDLKPGRELERARFGPLSAATPAGSVDAGAEIGWTQTLTIEADKTGSSSHIEAHLLLTVDGGRTWTDELGLIGRHQLTGYFIRRDLGWILTDGGALLIGRPSLERAGGN